MKEQLIANLTSHFEKEIRKIIEEEESKPELDMYSLELTIEKRIAAVQNELLNGLVNDKHATSNKKKVVRNASQS